VTRMKAGGVPVRVDFLAAKGRNLRTFEAGSGRVAGLLAGFRCSAIAVAVGFFCSDRTIIGR
jgi:hypothetical protein